MRFLALLRAEWLKTMRMRTTYIAFVTVALLVILIQGGLYLRADRSRFVEIFIAWDLPRGWLVNGYQATLIAMIAAFSLLIAPMTIVTFARQIAGEDLRGTLRMILVRPVGRLAFLNAKFAICAVCTMLLMGFFFVFSYGMGLILFKPQPSITVETTRDLRFAGLVEGYDDFERVSREEQRAAGGGEGRRRRGRGFNASDVQWRGSIEGRIIQARVRMEVESLLITPRQSLARLAIAWALTSWALLTLGSIAFFYSALTKHPIAAMAMTIGTYFMAMIVQGLASSDQMIPLFQAIEPYLFTTEMNVYTRALAREIEWAPIGRGVALLGAYTAVFFAAAQAIFWRKDVTS